MLAGILFGGGALGIVAALVMHAKEQGMLSALGMHGKVQAVSSAEDDDDEDDDGDGDEDEDDEEYLADHGASMGGLRATNDDLEAGHEPAMRPESLKAFVALGDDIHTITLPLTDIQSWGGLSQTIHETCEDNHVTNLPVHGIMHIVLNINGKTVPVTASTPLEELWKAKAIKVSITDEDEDDEPVNASRRTKAKKGSRSPKR